MNLLAQVATLTILAIAVPAKATIYRHITAESATPASATINDDGSLTEDGVNYRCIYKPEPPVPWVLKPWIKSWANPAESFQGSSSIALEVDAQKPNPGDVDKVQLRISSGRDSFALGFGTTRYTGFALKLPRAGFELPTEGFMLAQWWQGSPYGPPVRLAINNKTKDAATWDIEILNNDTLGNPSSKSIAVKGATIAFDSWTTFVVMLTPDFKGNGKIKVWQDGTQVVDWKGKVGYDPASYPYKTSNRELAHPNQAFDVFFGPYRARQMSRQLMYFDEIRFTDNYDEAIPQRDASH